MIGKAAQPLETSAVEHLTRELMACVRHHYHRRPISRATAAEVLNAAAIVVATVFTAARACGDEAGAREFFGLALEQQLGEEGNPTTLAELEKAAYRTKTAPAPDARIEIHNPPNYLGRIDHLYAVLSLDDGGEGVCAAPLGDSGITATLVAADKQRFDTYLRPIARQLAKALGKPVRIAKFTARQDVEIFQP